MDSITLKVNDEVKTKGVPEGIAGTYIKGHLVTEGKAAYAAFMAYKDAKPYMIMASDVNPTISPFVDYPCNYQCLCGSGRKFEKCCREQLPLLVDQSEVSKMRMFVAEARKKYKEAKLELV